LGREGLEQTYFWIKGQVEKERGEGIDVNSYSVSEVVVQTTDSLEQLANKEEKKEESS